jgi:tetratricopeptide (TPR) repeat protein
VRARFSIGWLLAACLLSPLPSRGQSPESKFAVSARELSIPSKAHQAFQKGAQLLLKNDAEGSLVHFQRAVAAYANYYEAYYDMGVANLRLSRLSDAELAFQKSIDLSGGQYPQPLFGLGAVLVYQNKFAEAEEVTRKGLGLDANSWSGHCYLGWALFGLNRLEEAEKSVREALRLKADSTEALRLLADIHSREKDYRALLNDLDEYLKLDPDSPIAIRARALRSAAERLLESPNTTALAQPQP